MLTLLLGQLLPRSMFTRLLGQLLPQLRQPCANVIYAPGAPTACHVRGALEDLLATTRLMILFGELSKRSDIPAIKERMWLLIDDWKRPVGLTLVSWLNGRWLTCDATLVNL